MTTGRLLSETPTEHLLRARHHAKGCRQQGANLTETPPPGGRGGGGQGRQAQAMSSPWVSAQARKGPSSPSSSHQGQLTSAGNHTNKQTQVRLILTLGFCLNSAFSKRYHLNLHQCNPLMTSCFYTVLSHCLWNPVFTPVAHLTSHLGGSWL